MTSVPVLSFALISSAGALAVLGIFVGSVCYDLRMIKKYRPMIKKPNSKLFRHRPLVSIVLVNSDSAATQTSLKSIISSTYRKYEVVIVHNAASDDDLRHVRDFIAAHPKKTIRLVVKRKPLTPHALALASHRAVHGELIMELPSGVQLQRDTLKHAVEHFLLDTKLQSLKVRRIVVSRPSVRSAAMQLGTVISARISKAKSGFGLKRTKHNIVIYRKQRPPKARTPLYAANVVVAVSADRTKNRQITALYLLSAVAWLVLSAGMIYIWYLALSVKVVQPLAVLWAGVSAAGLLFALSDDAVSLLDKLRMISLLPLWYIFSCVYMLWRSLSPLGIITRLRIKISLAP